MLWLYVKMVFRFAVSGTIIRADKLQIASQTILPPLFGAFILPIASMLANAMGIAIPEFTLADFPELLGIFIIGWLLIRAICAPYFIWMSEVDRSNRLEEELGSPEFIQRKHLAVYVADRKAELARSVAIMSDVARHNTVLRIMQDSGQDYQTELFTKTIGTLLDASKEATVLVSELSYIPYIQDNFIEFNTECLAALKSLKEAPNSELDMQRSIKIKNLGTDIIRSLHLPRAVTRSLPKHPSIQP